MINTTQQILLRFALIAFTAVIIPLDTSFAQSESSNRKTYTQIAQNDRWTNQVRTQLIQASIAIGLVNYRMTHNPFIGDLGRRGQDDITLNLKRGTNYAIIGVCDNDCRDIDLQLYDDNGNLVASDTKDDDTPVVRITPRWNAQFTIRVIMSSCSNAPCRYGIGFFGK
ncbi:hypothetical protein VB774_09255 [Pseudanabaena galeata UHCC 0370]|uniref:Uncharacterized protein n=1 Tax=Pseudanabaena galeata UHCC 0370 TaxID=3110310 RepID=A0ABU5THP6_9CYAN|nr:hypothetical protein [Pseudanabaena galeata]MEA5477806.1 hypothetical protein [Pseudanabaena galeata UHCC 0370]